MNTELDVREVVREVRRELESEGIGPALRVANAWSRHRFTALYRFDGDVLRNLYLVDKKDPSVTRSPDQPVMESYCIFVRKAARTFAVDHAVEDDRVSGHPKQPIVQSYCGIPLVDQGELYGTLCHFDLEPIPITRDEVWVLEEVAPDIIRWIRANKEEE